MLSEPAKAKLKRFSQQLNVSRSDLMEFLIGELELMTVNKFEEQKRLLELDSQLMEKYFGNDVEITSDGDWDHIKKLDTKEHIEHVLKPETNSTILNLEGLIQNVYDVIGDLQKGKIITEDIPEVYKQFLDGYPHLHNNNEFRR